MPNKARKLRKKLNRLHPEVAVHFQHPLKEGTPVEMRVKHRTPQAQWAHDQHTMKFGGRGV